MRNVTNPRTLIVGEAPGPAASGPTLGGTIGRRLTKLAGVERLDEAFDLMNLFEDFPGRAGKGSRFPSSRQARARAAEPEVARVVSAHPRVVLLGRRVAGAFGFSGVPYLRWIERGAHSFAVFPHPSGISRWFNDPENFRRAGEFLAEEATR